MEKRNRMENKHESLDKNIIGKIKAVRLLILDVDGVLTDGRIIMDDEGRETKNFNVKDGHGLKMLIRYGVDVVLLTGRRSLVVEHRAKDLGIAEVHQGSHDKVAIFREICKNRSLDSEHVAYIGDDIVDIPLLKRVGFSAAVSDATEEVKRSVDYVATKTGGNGAVREVSDLILRCQGQWTDVIKRYDIS
jgi:3-deoxy-D-manno-octulosonate 8-phosphate phosphatase (KDO 8-P phosphatase)